MKRVVIFDFDGTLANSVELILALYNEHAEQFGYKSIQLEELPTLRAMGYRQIMREKKIRFWKLPRLVRQLGKEMHTRIEEVEPYDGIIAGLKQLQSSSLHIGVLTSNDAHLVQAFFERHNFPSFDFVVSERRLFRKHRALRKIMKQYSYRADEIIYVGDEIRDVYACRKAGVAIVGVSWGISGAEGFAKVPPDVIVHTPAELIAQLSLLIRNTTHDDTDAQPR